MAQGRAVFNAYSRQSSVPSTAQSAGPSPGSYGVSLVGGSTGGVISRKRSAPSDTLTPLIGRPLAPKQPSTFGSEPPIRPSITGYQPISPMVDPSPRLNEPRKKRGRPTKQEAEERRKQMEMRQEQRRLQQAAATSGQLVQTQGPYGPQMGPAMTPMPTASYAPIPREDTPSGPVLPPPPPPPTLPPGMDRSQTPRQVVPEEQTSSGSSGKRRKVRPPRLSDPDLPPPPTFRASSAIAQQGPSSYESPPQHGAQLESSQYQRPRLPAMPSDYSHIESEGARFDTDEDNRPPNPRSRPWEVMGSGP